MVNGIQKQKESIKERKVLKNKALKHKRYCLDKFGILVGNRSGIEFFYKTKKIYKLKTVGLLMG